MAASFRSLPASSNNKWYFTRQQIDNSPSRRAGLDPDKELSYRQQAANLLQDMGQRLNVSQLTINTAIVYMHRFYMIQSFTRFHRNVIAPAALFLAAKVEEQPRKLEHVIKVAHACLNPQEPSPDIRSDAYLQQAQDLVILESIILQTLAFEITIDHPHTHVVKCTQLVRGEHHFYGFAQFYLQVFAVSINFFSLCSAVVPASKDLAQTSYFMATNSLHLTTFCLQYSPPVVACVCIHLACKWSNWEIPVSTDGKHWWEYVDPTVTLELLDELTHEFLQILEKTPSRLKRIRNWKAGGQTPKAKPKVQEEGDQRDTMISMISMASSESTVAGLMSLSAPPSASSSSSVGEKDTNASGSAQTWSGKGQGGSEQQSQQPQQQPNHEVHAPAKVSLSEYRAKNADVLAAQKRKLENMEASVKRDYANAAQALIGQQQRKEKQQHHHHPPSASSDMSNPSPIILKIPLEKERHDSLKMRFPVAGGSGGSSGHSSSGRGQDPDIKVKIRVPEKQRGTSGEDGKSRDKHRERSNHHHHYHHSHHHHSSSSSASLSSSHKHSSSSSGTLGSSKKVPSDSSRTSSSSSSSSSSASRKRTHSQDPSAGSHPPSKVSKSRNPYQLPPLSSSSGQILGHGSDILPSLGLPHHQGSYSHSKSDKTDTNGHSSAGGAQSNEYQDTFEMLNSLLSAQGVQPSQQSMFDYRSQYGDYRYSSSSRGNNPRPPPLPTEPPPPLPPLPK
ncbi:cyclin-T1 isoform X1 [Neolamprologus brichardi]|uniref:cyclin-T1 isoform X1 n=1 Tax=Neolamprologus brichardi TaxID=32507 RepID=UPI0016439575|nr:cyclin-T1 isoform X1 [Neolamprologus brichardi]